MILTKESVSGHKQPFRALAVEKCDNIYNSTSNPGKHYTNRRRENRSRELGKLMNTVVWDEYCSLSRYWEGGDTEKRTDMQCLQE